LGVAECSLNPTVQFSTRDHHDGAVSNNPFALACFTKLKYYNYGSKSVTTYVLSYSYYI